MGRIKKYHTEQQRSNACKRAKYKFKQKKTVPRFTSKYWRLVIPNLTQYGTTWTHTDSVIGQLRANTLDKIMSKQRSRGLVNWLVAVQRHPGSLTPHLDILLVYTKSVKNSLTRYDYLIKHGNLTRYRSVNAAILDYGRKQDPQPLGNLNTNDVLTQSRVKTDLYEMMQAAMRQDPFKFDPIAWLVDNEIMASAVKTNMYKTIRAIKDCQNLECNRRLTTRPGFCLITPELIREKLSATQLALYRSWSGYQTIIDHLNQIPRWGCRRPHKTKNLFVVGPSNTGKTTLGLKIAECCATYPLGTPGGWFPNFQNDVYSMLVWDEFNLNVYRYPDLLKLLQGQPMKLPTKGGHVERDDNQMIYMTSNLALDKHVDMRWKTGDLRAISRNNLCARITEVVLPPGISLFVLCKLIVPVKS